MPDSLCVCVCDDDTHVTKLVSRWHCALSRAAIEPARELQVPPPTQAAVPLELLNLLPRFRQTRELLQSDINVEDTEYIIQAVGWQFLLILSHSEGECSGLTLEVKC